MKSKRSRLLMIHQILNDHLNDGLILNFQKVLLMVTLLSLVRMKINFRWFGNRDNILISVILAGYLIASPFLSFAYDMAYYFQYFRWVYLYHVDPFFLWTFGAFYNAINIGALSLNVPFYLLGIDNVLVQQFSEKLPLIISAVLIGYSIRLILKSVKPARHFGGMPVLIFLLLPITIFDVEFMANDLIVALMFLSLSLVFLVRSKPRLSAIFLGASTATILYPIFFALPFIRLVKKNHGKKVSIDSLILFSLVVMIGQLGPLGINILSGVPLSDTILSPFISVRSFLIVPSSAPNIWSPFYVIYYLSGKVVSTHVQELSFIVLMMIPVVLFLLSRPERVSVEIYLKFLFLESLFFVIFAISASPQYLLAIAPCKKEYFESVQVKSPSSQN